MENRSRKNITLEEAKKQFAEVKRSISNLLYAMGDDAENLQIDRGNLDQEFFKDEYKEMFGKLESVWYQLEYLSGKVIDQGFIRHNDCGRYELPSGRYFTSGSTLEILYNDKRNDVQYWVHTRIEHNGDDYYAFALGSDFNINGSMVRVRRERD